MGGLSDTKTNRRLLLTSYLLWPRYATARYRRWLRSRLQLNQIKKNKVLTPTGEFKVPTITDPNSDLATKGFLFVKNFLDETSYLRLIRAWPTKRWFEPPPWTTASLSVARRPGAVLRVSRMMALVPLVVVSTTVLPFICSSM